jgi:hypothetical protein
VRVQPAGLVCAIRNESRHVGRKNGGTMHLSRLIALGFVWLAWIEPDDASGERGRRGTIPADGHEPTGSCLVPINAGATRVVVNEATRRACVGQARLLEPEAPSISDDLLRTGPPGKVTFASTDTVYCRLRPVPKRGGSLKFRCMRTDSSNRLYDREGRIVPDATSFDADGNLLDAQKKPIFEPNGNPREGDELRVKYFRGEWPEVRYREMFTETVVSRLFWALGIPADRVYMPASVRCFGCGKEPFGQQTPEPSTEARTIGLASVKRPYEGRKIFVVRKSGFLGLGMTYDHGWGFREIGHSLPNATESQRIENEVLAVALNVVAYHNLHSYQNDLRCRPNAWNRQTGECSDPVAYISDVGGTFGGARAHHVVGDDEPEMLLHPRGDYITFSQSRVFDDAKRCVLHDPIGDVYQISEWARQVLDERIRGKLGREQLRIIFEQAHMHRLDKRVNELVLTTLKARPGPDLDRAVQLLWADEIAQRFDEILTAKCPAWIAPVSAGLR